MKTALAALLSGKSRAMLAVMSSPECIEPQRQARPVPTRGGRAPEPVAFTRSELTRILGVYGHFVAAGEWRDYAIDCLSERAVFSVFRKASEVPLYRIEKRPTLARRQGQWIIISMTGAILKRGHHLSQVLKLFDRQKLKLAT